jgi:hypothetical protein
MGEEEEDGLRQRPLAGSGVGGFSLAVGRNQGDQRREGEQVGGERVPLYRRRRRGNPRAMSRCVEHARRRRRLRVSLTATLALPRSLWVCLVGFSRQHGCVSQDHWNLALEMRPICSYLVHEPGPGEPGSGDATNLLVSGEPGLGCFKDRASLDPNLHAGNQTQSSYTHSLAHSNQTAATRIL